MGTWCPYFSPTCLPPCGCCLGTTGLQCRIRTWQGHPSAHSLTIHSPWLRQWHPPLPGGLPSQSSRPSSHPGSLTLCPTDIHSTSRSGGPMGSVSPLPCPPPRSEPPSCHGGPLTILFCLLSPPLLPGLPIQPLHHVIALLFLKQSRHSVLSSNVTSFKKPSLTTPRLQTRLALTVTPSAIGKHVVQFPVCLTTSGPRHPHKKVKFPRAEISFLFCSLVHLFPP